MDDLLLAGLESTKQVDLLLIQYKQSIWIKTSKTGVNHTVVLCLYKLAEYSLDKVFHRQEANICSIFIYADPFLWKHVLKQEGEMT